MQKLMNIRQACEFLGISRHTLNQWTSKRKLPFIKVGRRVLFDPADLLAFIQARRVEPRPWQEAK